MEQKDLVEKHSTKDEMVVDMKKRYPCYAWSKSLVKDGLRHFEIKYTVTKYDLDDV